MARVYFSQEEAQTLVGRHLENRRAFSGVPSGTEGIVRRASSTSQGFTVAIEWQLGGQGKPLLDWFSRDEYRRYLKEI